MQSRTRNKSSDTIKPEVIRNKIKDTKSSNFILIPILLIAIGLSELIGYYFDMTNPGFNYIILGIVMMVIIMMVKKND